MVKNSQSHNFDTPVDRSRTNSIKWGSRTVKRDALTSLSVADMDFAVDTHILEAMERRLEHPIFGYEFTPDSLNKAFAAWQLQRHGFAVDTKSIVHLPGVVTGIALALLCLSVEGDGVVIQPPVYPPFFEIVKGNDRHLLLNPLLYNKESSTWSMDLPGLEMLFANEHPKIMLLCSPHNPVGRVWSKGELQDLAKLCQHYNVILISDDIHADFIFSNHFYTPLAVATEENHATHIQIMSPAKSFNIPGIGMAFAIVPDAEHRKTIQDKLRAMGLSKPDIMSVTAAQAAYEHGAQWFDAVLDYIETNQQIFREQIGTGLPWARISVVEGSFVAWLDLQDAGLSHAELATLIRHKAKLMLFDGLSFGEEGEFFFRLNLACPRVILHDAISALVKTLAGAKDRGPVPVSLDSFVDKRCCG